MRHNTYDSGTNGSSGASLATTFVAGALAGAAVALLYAPARGRETRTYLRTKARSTADSASRAVDSGKQMLRRQKARIGEVVETGREHLDEAAKHAARAVSTGRKAAADVRAEGQKAADELQQAARKGQSAVGDIANDVRRPDKGW
jgi:gas vesicle protein